ncbi:MAG: ATP-binding cassette domain-containing protein [Ignavibacteriaceae bacterium]|nr:ATP-binding cassette domain-containing protein [Ignavibacteriaceae bacterium]
MLVADKLIVSFKQPIGLKPLLLPLSFCLKPNNVYSIIGKNGSGKTTLIKALTRLNDDAVYKIEGKVWFNDINLFEAAVPVLTKIRREKIKYVFQDSINSFDPLKKLKYYFKPFLKQPDLHNLMKYFLFDNPNEVLELYSYELSGGMAQRLSIILALLYEPDILILDEPTSGIDYPIINLLLHAIKQFIMKENKIVLLVTHDLQFAEEVSNMISILQSGALSEFLQTKEFFSLENNSLIKAYREKLE